MVYLIVALLIFFVVCVLMYLYAGITYNGLPVLMYHSVIDSGPTDDLNITTRQLDRQLCHLVKRGYTPILLSELLDYINQNKPLPSKPVLLTFDDGYKNNYTLLYPLLQQYNLKANIFLVAGFIKASPDDKTGKENFLNVDQIREMNSAAIEFGLHSYEHKSYNDLTISGIEEDIVSCRTRLNNLGIPFQPCLAYTYGAFPKKDSKKRYQMFRTMEANGIQLAFRIGNKVNKLPLKDKFLLQRIDIRGDESFSRFKLVLFAGKKILFK
jgi:hypothetical protein